MKRIAILCIIGVMLAATLSAAAIPAQAKYNPAPVMRPNNALATNLVAYWKLDEASGTRNDSVGTNHLTSNNNVGQATGKHNYAANFVAASSQYLSASSAIVPVGGSAGDFSISMWLNPVALNANQLLIVQQSSTPRIGDFYAYIDIGGGGKLYFARYRGTGGNLGDSRDVAASNLSAGSWNHVVFTWAGGDGGTGHIFVNGSDITVNAVNNTNLGNFGNIPNTSLGGPFANYYFNGDQDSVGIWTRGISSSEVTTLYNSNAGCDYPFTACEATATPTATNTPLPPTATNTPLPPTATNTPLPPTATPTNTPTNTPIPIVVIITETPIPTNTATPGPSPTPTSTATHTATFTPTLTPTITPTPRDVLGVDLGSGTQLIIERHWSFGEAAIAIALIIVALVLFVTLAISVIQRWL